MSDEHLADLATLSLEPCAKANHNMINTEDDEFESTLMRKKLFHDDTDAKFKFMDGKIITFDKKLLCWCSKSPVFYQICFGPLSENVIEIRDFGYDAFQLFLNCIMGFIEITRESALEIFPIACKYLMTKIIEKCAVMLKPEAMNEDVCKLLNMAFFYNQPILCSVVKEFTLSQGSPYGLLENAKFSYLLSIDSFLEVIKWVAIDSCVLNAIVRWCNNFLRINNQLESIKELLQEFGLIEHFKIDLFESGISLYEFIESNLGKDIFPVEEVCKYFINPKYSARKKCLWIKKKKGEYFREEYDLHDLELTNYYDTSFKFGKLVAYESQNLNLSCTMRKYTTTGNAHREGNADNVTGICNIKDRLFKFNLSTRYLSSSYRDTKFEIKYKFGQDCRILVSNIKPRYNPQDTKDTTPLYTDKFYFTNKLV